MARAVFDSYQAGEAWGPCRVGGEPDGREDRAHHSR